MFIQPYEISELQFAFSHHVYFRWQTHRSQPLDALANLNLVELNELLNRYKIHVLEAKCTPHEALVFASLNPNEAVSTAASKIKGRVSRWLREQLELDQPTNFVSKGYFACTSGKSIASAIDQYLDRQGDHHGYAERARPPVFVRQWRISADDERRLQARHATTILQYHLVLSTWGRRGVFSQRAAEAVANSWRSLGSNQQFALQKVSFLPDHAHVALRIHPAVSPATLIVDLMNVSQDLIWEQFDQNVVRAAALRLWQPSAYLGSFGELASPQVSRYISNK